MKKTVVLFCMVLLLVQCNKNQTENEETNSLQSKLKSTSEEQLDVINPLDPCNDKNQFDSWGEYIFISLDEIISQQKTVYYNSDEILQKMLNSIPKEFLKIDDKGINKQKVDVILGEFISLYIKRNDFEAVRLSKKMELIVSSSAELAELDKNFILKTASILRYISYFGIETDSKSSERTFEQCWVSTLRNIENSGFFQRLACVVDWPVCLGAIAADCIVEQLQQ